ncbi:hypothetical protein KP509_1Z046500 [Ceratopteris richardii]|nr:hypothetical protein KP509_1Z046500 [Ceratopteris richardii]
MAIDAGDEAKLRSLLLVSTSSAEHIIDVCRIAESLLQSLHSPAQARNFFATFLPPLLQKIFGFQQQENVGSSPLTSSTSKPVSQVEPASSSFSQGWLSVISSSHDAAAAKSLVSLLSPEGLLLTSLLRLDKQSSSLRFLFPTERLPDWVQYALIKCAPSSLHSPSRIQFSRISKLFMDRIKPIPGGPSQVQLDTFEYFFFWFAFYAVCKHDRGGGDSSKEQQCKEASDSKVQKKSFPNWVSGLHNHRHSLTNWSIIHHASHQKNTNVPPLDPYLQLLQLYLTHYVPVSSSIRDYPSFARSEYDKASLGAGACLPYRTEFLLQTLTEFWLPNTDFSNAEDFVPPNLQLTNALRMLVNHINTLNPAFSGGGTSFTWSHIMQKPLYVFIRRAFKTWTSVTPVEKASRVVDVWLDFLQPWALNETMTTNSEVTASGEKFTENWHNFVSHNYVFYTNLTIYFLEFALKHVQRNVEAVLQMTSKASLWLRLPITSGSDKNSIRRASCEFMLVVCARCGVRV